MFINVYVSDKNIAKPEYLYWPIQDGGEGQHCCTSSIHPDHCNADCHMRTCLPGIHGKAWISNHNPQNTVGCNYLAMPYIPLSGSQIFIWKPSTLKILYSGAKCNDITFSVHCF